jgi:hypothetical protein
MKMILTIVFLLTITLPFFAQGELAEQPRIFYRNEKSLALTLSSNGFGINGRYAKRINARRKTIYDIDLVSIKHRKEVKISNPIIYNSKSFVFGKENSFFTLRGGYGKQVEMFRKVDKGGISIRRFYSAGPSIGFLKPIYYQIIYFGTDGVIERLETQKFNTSTHQQSIYGKASFLKGLDEISVAPGIYGRFGFMFEYSRNDLLLHALEAGISIDAFIKKIPIMATEKNDFFFFGLFVSYRFGKVFDARGIVNETDLIY